jgi:hypothetical protein
VKYGIGLCHLTSWLQGTIRKGGREKRGNEWNKNKTGEKEDKYRENPSKKDHK